MAHTSLPSQLHCWRPTSASLAAEASVRRAQAQFLDADHHLKRLEPLLVKEFTTTDLVETARTRQLVAESAVQEAQKNLIATTAAVEQAQAERLRADDAIG